MRFRGEGLRGGLRTRPAICSRAIVPESSRSIRGPSTNRVKTYGNETGSNPRGSTLCPIPRPGAIEGDETRVTPVTPASPSARRKRPFDRLVMDLGQVGRRDRGTPFGPALEQGREESGRQQGALDGVGRPAGAGSCARRRGAGSRSDRRDGRSRGRRRPRRPPRPRAGGRRSRSIRRPSRASPRPPRGRRRSGSGRGCRRAAAGPRVPRDSRPARAARAQSSRSRGQRPASAASQTAGPDSAADRGDPGLSPARRSTMHCNISSAWNP